MGLSDWHDERARPADDAILVVVIQVLDIAITGRALHQERQTIDRNAMLEPDDLRKLIAYFSTLRSANNVRSDGKAEAHYVGHPARYRRSISRMLRRMIATPTRTIRTRTGNLRVT